MKIFPAIDLIDGNAVRLFQGDYDKTTVYSERPEAVALEMKEKGARFLHVVDLEGAKNGTASQLGVIERIVKSFGNFVEVGGGIRSMETISKYIGIGVSRVILGTAAVTDSELVRRAVDCYGDKIAVGADIKDGQVAIRGWTETAGLGLCEFCANMEKSGVKTIICTDISRDGAMRGTNRELYGRLSEQTGMQITASGGVSSIDDVIALSRLGIYGAIIGKAYYTGDIDLAKAIEVSE